MNNIPPLNIMPKAKAKKSAAADKDKPRRPLSAYNLFFRFKRQKILEACKDGDIDRAAVECIVKSTPGLENISNDAIMVLPEAELEKLRSNRIRAQMEDNLAPTEKEEIKTRVHRKSQFKHGLSFLDMTTIVSSSWKECDALSKKIFEELAVDGRTIWRKLHADYTKAQEERAPPIGDKKRAPPIGDKKQGKNGGNKVSMTSFDSVRPNAIHKPSYAVMVGNKGTSSQGQGGGHNHTFNVNTNQHDMLDHMKRMYGNNPLSNNPYMPHHSLFNVNAHSSAHQTLPADKLKMVQLEVANESMKQMLEKLVKANADLKGENSHLIQLVGQLTAGNSTLKRNGGQGTPPSINYHPHPHQLLGFPNRQPNGNHPIRPVQPSLSYQEMLTPSAGPVQKKKKRQRVLADPWSQGPGYPHSKI